MPSLILPTLRRALTDAPPAPDPLAQLVVVINTIPGRVLIVLDNLEHLLPTDHEDEDSDDEEKSRFGPARIVRQLLESCPHLVFLATSRQPLGMEGEQQVAVEPLVSATGVELFVDRARAVRPDFTLHAGNKAEIEAICTLLDGLPLAIELAAAWVRVLTLPELRERLEKEVLWLEGRRRDLNPRQKSLEATLRWSWQLLSVEQKRLLSALSVFRGGWTLDAVEAVHRSPDTLDLLYNLVDKSLVVVEQTPDSTRYRLLETIRQFASERLDESGERDATHNRQAIFFLGLLSQLKDQLRGAGLKAALDSLEAEHDNFRAILRRPHDENRLTLVGRLARFWLIRGHFSEGREYLGKALDEAGSTALPLERALALLGLGSLERSQSDYVAARLHLEEALAIYRAKDEASLMAGVLQHLGVIAQEQKELTQAQSYFEEALGIYREKGQTISIANQLNSLGVVFSDQSEFTKARAYLEESFDLNRAIGDDHQSSINLVNLGVLAAKQGDLKTAKIHFERSLTIQREFGDLRGIVGLLSNLSLIAFHQEDYVEGKRLNQEVLRLQSQIGNQRGVANSLWFHGGICRVQGDWNQAVLFWSTATAFRERLGIAQLPKESADHPQELCDARTTLGKAAFEAAWEEGRQLSREDVVAHVLR